jgi:hypothetical protein
MVFIERVSFIFIGIQRFQIIVIYGSSTIYTRLSSRRRRELLFEPYNRSFEKIRQFPPALG